MESRKAWRNRDPSAGEGVLALLEALRNGLGADAVGLFDDDRAARDPDSVGGALNFWDAFAERPCAGIDWDLWYRELRKNERVDRICGCGGAHHLVGFLVHGRWALLLVVPPVLNPAGVAAIASSVRALGARLPPAKTPAEWDAVTAYEADESPPARQVGGGPVWWVRKPPH